MTLYEFDESNVTEHYYEDPQTDEDFIMIAWDVYGSGVRDNSWGELVEIGREYHRTGEI